MTSTTIDVGNKLKSWLACIRYQDAIVMQVPALVGVAFSLDHLNLETGLQISYCTIATFLLMAHIFSFNDWADVTVDYQDPHKRVEHFLIKDVTYLEMLTIATVLGIASLLLFAALSGQLLMLGTVIMGLSIIYSFPLPRFQGKRIPFLSSILHVLGSSLTFLLGYALFQEIDARGIYIGAYFGMLYAAGHLIQEVQDYEGDRLNGIQTHAVKFGRRPAFMAANVIFTLSYLYIFWLAHVGFVLAFLKVLVFLYPVYLVLIWKVTRSDLTFYNVRRLRDGYRLLYALIVLIMCTTTLTVYL